MRCVSRSAQDTARWGTVVGRLLEEGSVVVLQGALAAGKTCFVKGLALGLGIQEEITSPTFTLLAVYHGRLTLYHMDVYRLASLEDFFDIGAQECVYGTGVCVIEWGERVASELPEYTVTICEHTQRDGNREITVA